MAEIQVRPLHTTDLTDAAQLLIALNPESPSAVIEKRLQDILTDHPHYTLIGAFSGETLVGVTGAWIATKIWCGRYLEIDNFVVCPAHRSTGIGSLLIKHLESMARERDCRIMVIDSYAGNHASHRLYHRLGFEIWSFHFIKPIGDWKGTESS